MTAPSPNTMYKRLLRHDLSAFGHRAFLELNSPDQASSRLAHRVDRIQA